MNIKGKKFCVLGSHGFIGSALSSEITRQGGIVSSYPSKDTVAVFNFAAPTHLPFEKNPDYCTSEAITSFLYLLPFCRDNNIQFVWASSALVYEKDTAFASLKKTLENLQSVYSGVRAMGLRIFPVYGASEGERGHPTAIYQWVSQMIKGEAPVVYGNGKQARDFIYIDDVVDNILKFVSEDRRGIIDVGAGMGTVFNDIINIINDLLGTKLKPKYIPAPVDYSEACICQNPVDIKVDIREGVKRIIDEIKGQG